LLYYLIQSAKLLNAQIVLYIDFIGSGCVGGRGLSVQDNQHWVVG